MAGGKVILAKRGARSYKKRRQAIRRYKKRSFYPLSRSLGSGMPDSIAMKMKYSTILTPTTTTTAQTHFYSLNNLFDPDVTGVGHQPYYFDEVSAIYARYYVMGCSVKVTANVTTGAAQLLFKAQRDVTGLSATSIGVERPGMRSVIVNAGGPSKATKTYYSIPNLFGLSKDAYKGENAYHGTFDTNPTLQYYLQLAWQHPDQVSTASGTLSIELEYYCKWYDRKRVSQS